MFIYRALARSDRTCASALGLTQLAQEYSKFLGDYLFKIYMMNIAILLLLPVKLLAPSKFFSQAT